MGQGDPGLGPQHNDQKADVERITQIGVGSGETGVTATALLAKDMGKDIGRIAEILEAPALAKTAAGIIDVIALGGPRRTFRALGINLARIEPRAGFSVLQQIMCRRNRPEPRLCPGIIGVKVLMRRADQLAIGFFDIRGRRRFGQTKGCICIVAHHVAVTQGYAIDRTNSCAHLDSHQHMSPQTDLHQRQCSPKPYDFSQKIRKGLAMMNGYFMGHGGIWMVVIGVLVVLAIAALVKYLRK